MKILINHKYSSRIDCKDIDSVLKKVTFKKEETTFKKEEVTVRQKANYLAECQENKSYKDKRPQASEGFTE